MLLAASALVGILGIWLFLCDSRNGFAMPCLLVGLAGMSVGGYFGI